METLPPAESLPTFGAWGDILGKVNVGVVGCGDIGVCSQVLASPWVEFRSSSFFYQTKGGFVAEVAGDAIPAFYCPDSQKLTWFDSYQVEVRPYRDGCLSWLPSKGDEFQYVNLVEVQKAFLDLAPPNYDGNAIYPSTLCDGQYLLSSARVDCTERAMKAFRPRQIKFLAHRVTICGKAWLVPAYIQNSTEATARNHTTHFEDVTMNREHNSGLIDPLTRRISIWSRTIWIKFGLRCWSRSCSRSLFTSAIRLSTSSWFASTSLTPSYS